jgi:hypothetical protein
MGCLDIVVESGVVLEPSVRMVLAAVLGATLLVPGAHVWLVLGRRGARR